MTFESFDIAGPVRIVPKRYSDDRGHFSETFKEPEFREAVGDIHFIQDNESLSRKAGTVRGLHYQAPPHAQGKLVRCVRGAIIDVAVDARRGSPSFGQHVRAELSGDNGHQLWVPSGFLHGFATLEPDTVVAYKVTDAYSPESDGSVAFDDPDLDIDWGIDTSRAILSGKDRMAPRFAEWSSPFGGEG